MITKYASNMIESSNMILISTLCLLVIISLTNAQTKVKCFDHNKGRDKTVIILDCSKMAGKNNQKIIADWIQYHVFFDDESVANRVLSINLENSDFQEVFKFSQMPSLKQISFKNNKILSIENKAFVELPVLEELDLSFNLLNSHVIRKSIFIDDEDTTMQISNEESTIKILKLGHNNIHSLSPSCFEYLKKLEVLELNDNPLLVIDQNTEMSLGYLTNLQVLNLGTTGISHFPSDMFFQLKIETLYLNGNRFQYIPKEIRSMPLAYLNMNANPIVHLDSESFVGLDEIQQLTISGMPRLSSIESGTFAPLTKLVILHASHNPNLSYIHPDAFRDHSIINWSIRQLFISDTNLSSIDSRLYAWSKLDLFDARSNQWMCDCKLSWLADYINATFASLPESYLYYRCHEPKELYGVLVSQLNDHIVCDEIFQVPPYHSHGHVTRLRHFIIVIGLVISIFVFGTLINIGCREIKKVLKPRICIPARFSTGVKYRPADFEDNIDTAEEPIKNTTSHGRSPIVINNVD